jgi:hypothetical protein
MCDNDVNIKKNVYQLYHTSLFRIMIISTILSLVTDFFDAKIIIYVISLALIFFAWKRDIEGCYRTGINITIMVSLLSIGILTCLIVVSFSVFYFVFSLMSHRILESILSIGIIVAVCLLYSCFGMVLKTFRVKTD